MQIFSGGEAPESPSSCRCRAARKRSRSVAARVERSLAIIRRAIEVWTNQSGATVQSPLQAFGLRHVAQAPRFSCRGGAEFGVAPSPLLRLGDLPSFVPCALAHSGEAFFGPPMMLECEPNRRAWPPPNLSPPSRNTCNQCAYIGRDFPPMSQGGRASRLRDRELSVR